MVADTPDSDLHRLADHARDLMRGSGWRSKSLLSHGSLGEWLVRSLGLNHLGCSLIVKQRGGNRLT
ncbi:hypothetical protein [Acetobacter fallax]|uniref:hypothetical protein n=1 Tax=Acetobacter fallax TaxID=1737473 RepID=UPI001F5537B4|nr:hypothetical protein [Acetobacter fallax]